MKQDVPLDHALWYLEMLYKCHKSWPIRFSFCYTVFSDFEYKWFWMVTKGLKEYVDFHLVENFEYHQVPNYPAVWIKVTLSVRNDRRRTKEQIEWEA